MLRERTVGSHVNYNYTTHLTDAIGAILYYYTGTHQIPLLMMALDVKDEGQLRSVGI